MLIQGTLHDRYEALGPVDIGQPLFRYRNGVAQAAVALSGDGAAAFLSSVDTDGPYRLHADGRSMEVTRPNEWQDGAVVVHMQNKEDAIYMADLFGGSA